MSKRNNYTNYGKMSAPVDETVPVEVKEEVAEAVAEESAVEPVVEEKAEVESLIGMVSGCKLLNIRKKPTVESEAVAVVSVDTLLMIDPSKSKKEWYKVYTEAGVEGFCMKKFVTIK